MKLANVYWKLQTNYLHFKMKLSWDIFFLSIVCGRTFQETKVSFGSPQHTTVYKPSPGTRMKPFRMVSRLRKYNNKKTINLLKKVCQISYLFLFLLNCYKHRTPMVLGRHLSMEDFGNTWRKDYT